MTVPIVSWSVISYLESSFYGITAMAYIATEIPKADLSIIAPSQHSQEVPSLSWGLCPIQTIFWHKNLFTIDIHSSIQKIELYKDL